MRRTFALVTCFRVALLFSGLSVATAAEVDARAPHALYSADVISAQDLLRETNNNRIAVGLAPLNLNDTLSRAAEAKAQDMVTNGYWDHFRPGDHKAPWDFIKEAGYTYKVAGENLARGFRTAGGITQAWMHSPAHAANLLSPRYHDVGFATVYTYDSDGERVLLTVQMFGAQ